MFAVLGDYKLIFIFTLKSTELLFQIYIFHTSTLLKWICSYRKWFLGRDPDRSSVVWWAHQSFLPNIEQPSVTAVSTYCTYCGYKIPYTLRSGNSRPSSYQTLLQSNSTTVMSSGNKLWHLFLLVNLGYVMKLARTINEELFTYCLVIHMCG
jgi:hypothetical protein